MVDGWREYHPPWGLEWQPLWVRILTLPLQTTLHTLRYSYTFRAWIVSNYEPNRDSWLQRGFPHFILKKRQFMDVFKGSIVNLIYVFWYTYTSHNSLINLFCKYFFIIFILWTFHAKTEHGWYYFYQYYDIISYTFHNTDIKR